METWQKNLLPVVVVQAVMMAAFSSMSPFIAPFITELGITNPQSVKIWAGLLTSINALFAALFSPYWGSLSDRYGRKIMVIRSTISIGIFTILMGMATSVYQLLILRILMGSFAGFSAASLTLVAGSAPREKLGLALGWLQAGQVLGLVFGPTLGGLIADLAGYRTVFFFTGGVSLGATLLTLFTVHEDFQRRPAKSRESNKGSSSSPLKTFRMFPSVAVMFIVLLLTQFSVRSVEPIMALYVAQIEGASENLNTLTGAVFAVTGLAQAVGLLAVGHFSNVLGYRNSLLITLLGSGLLYLPQALVTNVWQLLFLRALFGIFLGGILPMANAIIGAQAPQEIKGQIFGLTSSATFLGNFAGPTLGGLVSAYLGIPAVFALTGCLLLVNTWLVWRRVAPETAKQLGT